MAGLHRLDPAVQHNLQLRKIRLQLRRHVIAQRRNVAILLRRQPLQNRNPRMHGKTGAPGIPHRADEITQLGVTVPPIDPDAMLHRHRNRHRIRIAFTQSATNCGCPIRHAPIMLFCTRSLGQPTFRFTSS
jgi:hypothetical protein